MRIGARLGLIVLACAVASSSRAGTESTVWSGYLDDAYVYSSADSKALRASARATPFSARA